MSNNNAYMRKYMLRRYRDRLASAKQLLGNQCKRCGSKQNLELDHIDPQTKLFSIAKLWSINISDFWREVHKCQLLCVKCHSDKTIKDSGKTNAKGTHGTLSAYRYCKCDLCKKAKADYMKVYKAKRLGK